MSLPVYGILLWQPEQTRTEGHTSSTGRLKQSTHLERKISRNLGPPNTQICIHGKRGFKKKASCLTSSRAILTLTVKVTQNHMLSMSGKTLYRFQKPFKKYGSKTLFRGILLSLQTSATNLFTKYPPRRHRVPLPTSHFCKLLLTERSRLDDSPQT